MKTLILLAALFPIYISAETVNYKPLSIQVESGDQVRITGFSGKVSLQAVPNAKVVTVRLSQSNPSSPSSQLKDSIDEWLFSMQKNDSIISINVRSPQSKNTWSRLLTQKGQQPQFELSVSLPSIPVNMSWRDGDVMVVGLKSSLKAFLQSGNVSIKNHEGSVLLSHQKGAVSVSSIKGDIDIDSYAGKVTVQSLEGPLKLRNFSGTSSLSDVSGSIDFTTFDGQLNLVNSKGRVEYSNTKGKINLDKFQGNVRGKAEQGSLSAVLVGSSNVRVSSKEGSVSLQMLNSSARVNAGTKEGALNTPQYLRLTRLPNLRLVRGSLRGKVPGQVYVRTESGSIRIR